MLRRLFQLHTIPPSYYSLLLPRANALRLNELVADFMFPSIRGIFPSFIIAAVFALLRALLEWIAFKPLAKRLMRERLAKFTTKHDVEEELKKVNNITKMSKEEVLAVCSKTGYSDSEIGRYVWNRQKELFMSGKVTEMVESMLKAVFYTCMSIFGLFLALYPTKASWIVAGPEAFWSDWPVAAVPTLIDTYYQLQLGFYIQQLLMERVSQKNALFVAAMHSLKYIFLVFSFLSNFRNLGHALFLLNDLTDMIQEIGNCVLFSLKSNRELNTWRTKSVTASFILFVLLFLSMRILAFPRFVLHSAVVDSANILGFWMGYYILIGILGSMFALHLLRFLFMPVKVYRLFTSRRGVYEELDGEDEYADEYMEEEDFDPERTVTGSAADGGEGGVGLAGSSSGVGGRSHSGINGLPEDTSGDVKLRKSAKKSVR